MNSRESELLAALARANAKLDALDKVLAANGCDCECGHHYSEHDGDCERCLGCRIKDAINKENV